MTADGPRAEYERRLEREKAAAMAAESTHRRIGRLRLVTALVGIGVAWAALDRAFVPAAWVLVPGAFFFALVLRHDRVKRQLDRTHRVKALYEAGLARLDGRWQGHGARGDHFVPEHHLYAVDLDLFGKGSLFELLSRARTRHGERRLAQWLLQPGQPGELRERQEAITELRERLDLREDLAVAGRNLREAVDADRLAAWGGHPAAVRSVAIPSVAALCSTLTVVTFLLGVNGVTNGLPLVLAVGLQGAFWWWARPRVEEALRGVDRASSDLGVLADLVARLEDEALHAPRGRALREALSTRGTPASHAIHSLRRRLEIHDAAHNLLFLPIAIVLLWPVHGAFWVDRWRLRFGSAVETWLEAIGELEALSSLASHAFEHPEDTFPEFDSAEAVFAARNLGHPLLPETTCVRNDVSFGGQTPALIASGSNMSGKTTLLRAVGTNAVLALAGAPVRARQLRMSRFEIGASIRTQDSLLEGRSRFQAEIDRIRDLMERAATHPPLLFLLDEVLAGTNSHDRRIGAVAILRGLLDRGAVGLATTHDLALAEIDAGDGHRIENVHFEDHVEDGEMIFDYRMRPGVVRRSNAIALMRAVGLPV